MLPRDTSVPRCKASDDRQGSVPYGLGCSKVSEAEVMVAAGARDIRMIEQVVGRAKISRLISLAQRAHVIALADGIAHVNQLASAAAAAGIRLDVMIEIEIGLNRCGVPPGKPAITLAHKVAAEKSLRFVGVGAHEGTIADVDRERRANSCSRAYTALAQYT